MAFIRKLPSGSYRVRYRGPDGRERGATFDRRVDAERWMVTQAADVARGQWVDPALGRTTFAAYVSEWRTHRYGLRDSSIERIDGVIDGHLLPRFGPVPLAELSAADVKAMVSSDVAAGYSGSSVRRHVIVLRTILADAMADNLIGRNVAAGVRLPSEDARPMRTLDAGQLAQLADVVPDHFRALVLTAGWVGLRWGELAGLALDHVDLLRHEIRVDRQLTDVGGVLAFGPPKSKAGRRTVSIPAGLTEVLAVHFASDAVQRSGLAFPTLRGLPMRRANFRQRVWNPAVARAFGGTAHEGIVFHELRHTAASLAIAHGAHPLTVKERLGHSSIQVTLDRYGHMFAAQDVALAEALDGTLRASLGTRPAGQQVVALRR